MEEEVVNSDESYSDDDEEEELDPRIQVELHRSFALIDAC